MPGHTLPSGEYRTRAMTSLVLETGSGNSVQVGPFESDLQITNLSVRYKESIPIVDRGTYAGALEGADIVPEISLTVKHKGKLHSEAEKTIMDCLLYAGGFAGDSYTDQLGKMPSHKAVITVRASDGTDIFTCPNSAWTQDYSTGEANTLALKARCFRPQAGGDPDDATNQPIIRS